MLLAVYAVDLAAIARLDSGVVKPSTLPCQGITGYQPRVEIVKGPSFQQIHMKIMNY